MEIDKHYKLGFLLVLWQREDFITSIPLNQRVLLSSLSQALCFRCRL